MEAKTSSIVTKEVQQLTPDQLKAPTMLVLVVLIISLVILKSFIYIKDGKRHGK